jgi:hypothetical protein
MVRKAKGGNEDSFDSDGGKACGGKRIAGKSVGGKPVAGMILPWQGPGPNPMMHPFPFPPHMVGGPDSLPPWSKLGIDYPTWKEKFLKGLDKPNPARLLSKPIEKGGFLQFLPLIAPIVAPLLGNLLGNLFGNKGSGAEVEGGFLQFLLPMIGKLFGMGVSEFEDAGESEGGARKKKGVKKAKRSPSAYNLFIKDHWNDVSGSAQERMKQLGPMWREQKGQGGVSSITEGFPQ